MNVIKVPQLQDAKKDSLSGTFQYHKGIKKYEKEAPFQSISRETPFSAPAEKKYPSKRTSLYCDALLKLEIPGGIATSVPFSSLYDYNHERLIPSWIQTLEEASKDLIDSSIDIPFETREKCERYLKSSFYQLTYFDQGQWLQCTESSAAYYFQCCLNESKTPYLSISFPVQKSMPAA